MRKLTLLLAMLLLFVLAACNPAGLGSVQLQEEAGEEVAAGSVTERVEEPEPDSGAAISIVDTEAGKVMMNCMAVEPKSLYLYASDGRENEAARSASMMQLLLYERMYVQRNGAYEARGLAKLPDLNDGDAHYQAVWVTAGDRVMNAAGEVVTLDEGIELVNTAGERVTFSGNAVPLWQMVVTFELRPLFWSDGTPVSAADSVFSYQVAADPATPGDKSRVERTAGYEATGRLTAEWIGVPGWDDPLYFTNVWMPLPARQLGKYSAEALLSLDEATHSPLSYGPYMIAEWVPGRHIRLTRNPYYEHAAGEVSSVDQMVYGFPAAEDS